MIEANKDELFPITVSLVDEDLAELITGQDVTYDVRTITDLALNPPVSGTLTESTIESGIYKDEISINQAGNYICYVTCSGFITSTESILINEESTVEALRYNLPHNTSVIDVLRTTDPTPSQIARNVPLGKTDYIVTLIKNDSDLDWSNPVASGIVYAHYTATDQPLPYMMGAAF